MKALYDSPIGTLEITGSDDGIVSVQINDGIGDADCDDSVGARHAAPLQHQSHIQSCMHQLDEYFHGKREVFDLPLDAQGTDFQKSVWNAAAKIPFGQTATYVDLARTIKKAKASRAVGNALNANPLLILVPCHRVVPRGRGCGGFAVGSKKKEWLIELEKKG